MTSLHCILKMRGLNLGRAWRSLRAGLILFAIVALPAQAADLMVAAASSLTNAFSEIGKAYELARPGTRVLFNFGASGQLLQQISRGAPVDVLASADIETMDRADKERLILSSSRVNFAANKLLLVLPGASELKISTLADLGNPQVQRIAIGTRNRPRRSLCKERS